MRAFLSPALAALLLTVTAAVAPGPPPHQPPAPQTRTYYIAADEVTWDYVPGGRDEIAGQAVRRHRVLCQRPGRGLSRPSTTRCSTASTPTAPSARLKPRAAEWEHLGFLGPLIRARGRRHDSGRVPQQRQSAVQHPPARRVLREELRGCAVQRRHQRRRQGRRRRARRERPIPTSGRSLNAPARGRWTAAR